MWETVEPRKRGRPGEPRLVLSHKRLQFGVMVRQWLNDADHVRLEVDRERKMVRLTPDPKGLPVYYGRGTNGVITVSLLFKEFGRIAWKARLEGSSVIGENAETLD